LNLDITVFYLKVALQKHGEESLKERFFACYRITPLTGFEPELVIQIEVTLSVTITNDFARESFDAVFSNLK